MRSLGIRVPAQRPRRAFAGSAPVWLFDLDNTLHDSSKHIFSVIDGKMSQAVQTFLNVSSEQADILRKQYWKRYGATVIGLVKHHGVDANTFLHVSHDFDPAPLVHAERGLARKIQRLPGHKILLTNAPSGYAQEVLRTLGLLPCFDTIWSIDHMQLQGRIRPKPSKALMRQILARLGVPASRIVLVEDTLHNLRPAHQLGMKTVHMFHPLTPFSARHRGRSLYVDLRINSVKQLAATHTRLGL